MTDQTGVSARRRGAAARKPAPVAPDFGLNGSGGILLCSVLFAGAVLILLLGRLTDIEALSICGGFGVMTFGVGAAPLQLLGKLHIYTRLTGATLIGLSTVIALGALMADVRPLWHPVTAMLVVGLVATALHVIGLRSAHRHIAPALRPAMPRRGAAARARAAQPDSVFEFLANADTPRTLRSDAVALWQAVATYIRESERLGEAVAWGRAVTIDIRHSARPASGAARWSLGLTAAGSLVWLVPALTTHDPQPGVSGFLPAISPAWYAGLVLVVVAFAIGRRGEVSALAAALSFGLASTLTPALVYATPRAGAAAKQMLLTQYVLTHHHITPPAGIYQAYSGLFSGMAWLCQLMGVHGMLGHGSLIGLATYWPVLVVVARVVELRLFAGRLVSTPGRAWTAVMLVMLVDTINDANYFSPQSAGYILATAALAFVVVGVKPRPLGTRATFGMLMLVGVALGPTHEFTPYITAGALFVLAVFGQAPRWSCLPVGLPALAWAGVVHKAVGANFSFGQLFDLSNLLPPKTAAVPGLARLPAVGYQSHALLASLLILIGLAAIGFFANVRTRWAWGYGLCPVVGIGLILVNPYGNEGIFRSSLFAIPWLAILAMQMPHPGRVIGVLKRPAALTAATCVVMLVLLTTFVTAEWGVDGTELLWRSDIAVLGYLGSHAPAHAFVTELGAGGDSGVGYPPFLVKYNSIDWDLVAPEALRAAPATDPTDLVALTDSYGAVAVRNGAKNSTPLYIFWSPSILVGAQAYGDQSPSQMNGWLRLLKTSPAWRLVDRQGDTYLFELNRA